MDLETGVWDLIYSLHFLQT